MDWWALGVWPCLQIIGINVVLSGDNAVVLAMVIRRLPGHHRRLAVILGIGGAMLLQILATLVVARLLQIPLLLGGGGVLLSGLAWRLLQEDAEAEPSVAIAGSLGHAVWRLLVANSLMSLDNVLAVAGVGQGHPLLIVLGLLVSLGLLGTSSLGLAALMNQYPVLVTVGAGLLAWTAGGMMATDPVVQHIVWAHMGAALPIGLWSACWSAVLTALVLTSPVWWSGRRRRA